MPAVSGSVQGGYTLTIDVAIDPTTEQEMSDAAPMPGEGGPGDGGPGGPGGTPPQGQPPAGSPGADGATPPSGRPPQPPQN